MAPKHVSLENSMQVHKTLFPPFKSSKADLAIGDKVQVTKFHRSFQKGYLATLINEVHTIVGHIMDNQPNVYVLHDLSDELIKGTL